jgi:hypothetical protein
VQTLELGKWYEVGEYYICRTELSAEQKIAFPSDFTSCTVSSDNTGSVIITVRK